MRIWCPRPAMRWMERCSSRGLRRRPLRPNNPGCRTGYSNMRDGETGMAVELREAPDAVRRQETASQSIAELVARCRRKPPQVVVTCARGSSAHAATFGKHLIEQHLGIPVAAAAPNIATVYGQR